MFIVIHQAMISGIQFSFQGCPNSAFWAMADVLHVHDHNRQQVEIMESKVPDRQIPFTMLGTKLLLSMNFDFALNSALFSNFIYF